jgi:hypothetical protein
MPPRHGDDGQDGHRRAVAALSLKGRQRDRSRLIALALVALGVGEFAPSAPDNGTSAKLGPSRHGPCTGQASQCGLPRQKPAPPRPQGPRRGPASSSSRLRMACARMAITAHATFTKRSSYRSPVIRSPTPTADRRRLVARGSGTPPATDTAPRASPACQAACTSSTATSTPPARPRRAPFQRATLLPSFTQWLQKLAPWPLRFPHSGHFGGGGSRRVPATRYCSSVSSLSFRFHDRFRSVS